MLSLCKVIIGGFCVKVFKQLLWFIIPTALIWGFWFIYDMSFVNETITSNNPRFGDYSYYLELFKNDEIYSKAVFNTVFISFISAVLIGAVTYICKLIFKFNLTFMYTLTFGLTTLTAFFSHSILFGSNVNFSVLNIIIALQIGVICCFVCWLIDTIKSKSSKN